MREPSAGCATVRVVVEPPARCPRADAAAVAELEAMEEYDLCPAVRRYVLDEVEPFCDGLDAM